MRTGKLTFEGREYPLCFSTRVVCNVTDKYGDLTEMYNALGSDNVSTQLSAVMWVLAQMSAAGERYARLNGEDPHPALTEDQLWDAFGIDDLLKLTKAIMDTVTAGTSREVEAEPPKNAEATDG